MNYLSTILAPHFVGVYEFGNHIYYFFSDLSEENRDDGSRVGSDLNFKSRLIFDLDKKTKFRKEPFKTSKLAYSGDIIG
jgi:hypothetical protein